MRKAHIFRWVARGLLLFLSFCGIATLISNATLPLDRNTLNTAWVFGVGGIITFGMSWIDFKKLRR